MFALRCQCLVPGIDFFRSATVTECLLSAPKQSCRRKLNSGEKWILLYSLPGVPMVERFRACALGAKLPALHPGSAAYLLCVQEQVNYVP